MPSRDICDLCGAFCGPKYAKSKEDQWKRDVRELRIDQTGGSVDPEIVRYPLKVIIHRVCWDIVERIAPLESHDTCWLGEFARNLHTKRPHLRRVHDQASPLLLDKELRILLGPLTTSQTSISGSPACLQQPSWFHVLPLDLVSDVYSFLADVLDIVNFRLAMGLDPPLATWQRVLIKYHDWDLQCNDNGQFCSSIGRVVSRIEHKGVESSMWPHAAAYETVWKNCETVLAHFGQQPQGSLDDHNRQATSIRSGADERRTAVRIAQEIDLETLRSLTFRFNCIYNLSYLCGITLDEHTIGYVGDRFKTVLAKQWTGLRLVSDGQGFINVQIRSGSEWEDVVPMDRSENSNGENRYCEMKWDAGKRQRTLSISVDVSNDISILRSISLIE